MQNIKNTICLECKVQNSISEISRKKSTLSLRCFFIQVFVKLRYKFLHKINIYIYIYKINIYIYFKFFFNSSHLTHYGGFLNMYS